ncbi:hypothetical protein V502_00814 [Pseudogymnoascus sp. VKM F-4520 (FW-2644)]|nr:hypothetical protein V502_00814 [Pseudogymnoascus sp. VKM F-4520 (FW-2644)]
MGNFFLEYFVTEADAKYLASSRLNYVQIHFNYYHSEEDMSSRVLKVNLCGASGMYGVLDMHTDPDAQNCGWHSDNITPALGADRRALQGRPTECGLQST